jgi:hypothetical protein
MAAKMRKPLLLAGTSRLVRDMGPEMKKPTSSAIRLKTLPISK